MSKINFAQTIFAGAFVDPSQIQNSLKSEFLILGRSNVGKSSLINALTKKTVAKTSSVPGKTETINHYIIDQKISLYDLPGYGFAKFKSKRLGFSDFIDKFIQKKGNDLKAFLLLVDSRHNLSEDDAAMIDYLKQYRSPLVIVFTKIDKLNHNEQKQNIEVLSQQIKSIYRNDFVIFPFSTKIATYCKQLEKMMEIWAK